MAVIQSQRHERLQTTAIKKDIVIISQDFKSIMSSVMLICFALSGRINGVNLYRNIYVGIKIWPLVALTG